jgi:hypothetical protein
MSFIRTVVINAWYESRGTAPRGMHAIPQPIDEILDPAMHLEALSFLIDMVRGSAT